jgi:hypothetical protein
MRTRHILTSRTALALALLAVSQTVGAVKSGPPRKVPIDMVVLHSTGGPTCNAQGKPIWVPGGELRENILTIEAHPTLGVHYMIDRDGSVAASVPEDRLAYHVFGYSGRSIGIELVNDGDGADPFPDQQLAALVELLRRLSRTHGIGPNGVKRHSDLDSGRMACAPERRRKVDPGAAFPNEDVLRRVYGEQ